MNKKHIILSITVILFMIFNKPILHVKAGENKPDKIMKKYSLNSLLTSVVLLQESFMSNDYFNQFMEIEDDEIFSDYLSLIFGLDKSPYSAGTKTVIESGSPGNLKKYILLEKILLKIKKDGSRWWQVTQTFQGKTIKYKALISKWGIPLLVYSMKHKKAKIPFIAKTLPAKIDKNMEKKIKAKFNSWHKKKLQRKMKFMFKKPEILGEKFMETPAGKFNTIHIKDSKTFQDFYLSPDISGQIVKIIFKKGDKERIIQLTQFKSVPVDWFDESKIKQPGK